MAGDLPKPYDPGPPQPDDAETVVTTADSVGRVVDAEARPITFADVVSRADERRPIVPASLRSKAGRHSLLTLAVAMATHGILWELSRSPVYLGKVAVYGPWGLLKLIGRQLQWATHPQLTQLMHAAATAADVDRGPLIADKVAQARKARFAGLGAGWLAVLLCSLAIWYRAPWWAPWLALSIALPALARFGRPPGCPILQSAFNTSKFVRLTAELTRAALVMTGAGIKDPAKVKFNKEIYREGPGHMAEVSLPDGVIAKDVIDRRDYLAAGFQLPIAQVWPEPVKGAHPGVLAIWVADRPVDRMKQPKSPLLTCGQLDYFGPLPWGDDVRMRPLSWRLSERNSMFAGMVGSGKTLAARNVGLAASLDPLVRFLISELKGSGDFDAMEPLCLPNMYASGADDRAKQQTMGMLRWLDGECDRRGPAIRKWAVKGLNSQNKLNRAIAETDPSLFPLVAIFDEIQELITDPDLGKEAKRLLTSIVKRARSLGIHMVLSTQRIDKESVPKGISSNVHNRLCLAVPSHVETDLVLGTGAYSRGARPTTFVPPADDDNPWAGWGYLAGRDQPVRANYIDNPTAEAIVARALGMRGEMPKVDLRTDPDRDVLADVIRVFAHTNRPGLQWQQLAELLAEDRPALYAGITAEGVSAMVRAEGVASEVVSVDGHNARGCRRRDVEAARREAIGGGTANGDAGVSGAAE
jgi:S-DNA-T family DNA segregation ATPase FtsK/SpoIIIE